MSSTASLGKKVAGQQSWRLASDLVEAYVTETGGHVGPVTFKLGKRKIQPFSVAPWVEEKTDPKLPPIIKVLRGDFFCLPFGGNGLPFKGEKHPVHGETANARWRQECQLQISHTHMLHLSLRTKVRKGQVDKLVVLRKGESALYSRHILSGFSGPLNPGHHAMLKFPDYPGSGVISTSSFVHGQVFPDQFENPAQYGYQSLKPGASFHSLTEVPRLDGTLADLSRYPARRGFEDLVMLVSDPNLPFAWTAVTFPKERYVWFALKDPQYLRETIFWISNGGRHYAPWSSRHINVMGLEEVTSYFHCGLAESAGRNPLNAQGIPTVLNLKPGQKTEINYIMAMSEIPAGFDQVAAIEATEGGVVLKSTRGRSVKVPLNLGWLAQGAE
jgi:hypothetical protein